MKQAKKILFSFFILLLIITTNLFGKGLGGAYIIEGIMYDKQTGKAIPNIKFVINGKTITTNELGQYKAKISWTTECGFGLNFFRKWIFRKNNNPKHIVFKHENKEIKIKNKWRKYGKRYSLKVGEKNYVKNIYW